MGRGVCVVTAASLQLLVDGTACLEERLPGLLSSFRRVSLQDAEYPVVFGPQLPEGGIIHRGEVLGEKR